MRDAIREIIVGFDGSTGSSCALDWASDEAARRGQGLRIACATDPGVLPRPFAERLGDERGGRFTAAAASVLQTARVHARSRHPGLSVAGEVVLGPPAEVLVKAAVGADLLAVGSAGNGGLPGMLIGSVATAVAGSAHCAVVVTRGNAYLPTWKPIVVAYDGSPASAGALIYGIGAARRASAPLVIVTVWRTGFSEPWTSAFWAELYPGERAEAQALDDAQSVLREAAAAAHASTPSLQVDARVERGDPASVLIAASRTAGQVVTGVGPGRVASGLGSVNHALVNAASCPVVLVPPADPLLGRV